MDLVAGARRPAPTPSPLTAPYWEACRRGELAIQRCAGCHRFVHFPEPRCPYCDTSRLTFEPVSGNAVVHTFSVIDRAFTPWFAARTPYVIAWVELAEQAGLRAFGNVTGCRPQDVSIGMPVRTFFAELPGFGPVPEFRPAGTGRASHSSPDDLDSSQDDDSRPSDHGSPANPGGHGSHDNPREAQRGNGR